MSDIEDQQEREEILAIQKREESLKKLMQETGCEIVQENGQRKIGGPPPSKCSLISKHLFDVSGFNKKIPRWFVSFD